MNTEMSISAALEHARLVRKNLEDARKNPKTEDARELSIELVKRLEVLRSA